MGHILGLAMAVSDQQFLELAAKVTALEVLLETLVVDHLADTPDPAATADAIVKDALGREKRLRAEPGEHSAVMLVTDAIVSVLDRATARAMAQKKSRRRL